MELVKVTAAKPHRSGFAGGAVAQGESYSVPSGRVASLVRQGLIKDPATPEPKKPKKLADSVKADGPGDTEA